MNIDSINITLIHSAYSKVKTRESDYNSALSGTIIRGTLKTPNSQLVTPISIKLQRPDGHD
jgi:hypothetical protein